MFKVAEWVGFVGGMRGLFLGGDRLSALHHARHRTRSCARNHARNHGLNFKGMFYLLRMKLERARFHRCRSVSWVVSWRVNWA